MANPEMLPVWPQGEIMALIAVAISRYWKCPHECFGCSNRDFSRLCLLNAQGDLRTVGLSPFL